MPSFNRRALLSGSSAVAALLATGPVAAAPRIDIEPRGQRGIFTRLPDLNLESYQDFIRGMRQWSNFYGLIRSCRERADQIVKDNGLDPIDVAKMTYPQLLAMLDKDPTINMYGRAWLDGQYYKFKTLQEAFHARADQYFDEMESNDKLGPGTLELNPTMFIPDYTKHEIHTQLGGYVGDPLAGYIYLYDVLVLNDGRDEQDAGFIAAATACPTPKDGKVMRILDTGCGVGQFATSMQRRFPNAEVWGIDVGGPMVRYAHVRANDINSKVNFAQRLSEDSKFPDNYFDIVVSSQFHHEVTGEASKQIFKEIQRTLRPGGLYFPVDVFTSSPPPKDAFGRFSGYLTYRWNHEDWWMEWMELDREKAMSDAGLKIDANGPQAGFGTLTRPNTVLYKV